MFPSRLPSASQACAAADTYPHECLLAAPLQAPPRVVKIWSSIQPLLHDGTAFGQTTRLLAQQGSWAALARHLLPRLPAGLMERQVLKCVHSHTKQLCESCPGFLLRVQLYLRPLTRRGSLLPGPDSSSTSFLSALLPHVAAGTAFAARADEQRHPVYVFARTLLCSGSSAAAAAWRHLDAHQWLKAARALLGSEKQAFTAQQLSNCFQKYHPQLRESCSCVPIGCPASAPVPLRAWSLLLNAISVLRVRRSRRCAR